MEKKGGRMGTQGARYWRTRLDELIRSDQISGLEKIVVICIHCLHLATISGWIKVCLDPTTATPTAEQRRWRDRAIEIYVVVEWLVLLLILWVPNHVPNYLVAISGLILFEILLNLSNIIFVGKLDRIYPPTISVERSLLLFGINVLQVIMIFAIFYRAKLGLPPKEAAVTSTLVFGTVGYPEKGDYVVAAQIISDFALLAIFLSAFVGNLASLRRSGSR